MTILVWCTVWCKNIFFFQLRDEVIENYEKRRTKPDYGALCDEDIEILKNWQWNHNLTSDYANFLTAQVIIFLSNQRIDF